MVERKPITGSDHNDWHELCLGPPLPLKKEKYLMGEFTVSLFTYAMTKRIHLVGAELLGQQYGHASITFIPYPCDPYYHEYRCQMHFIYEVVRKIREAGQTGKPAELWGMELSGGR